MLPTAVIIALAVQAAATAAVPAERARPHHNLGAYVRGGDYPADALAERRTGVVHFELSVDARGRVTGCRITRSSGTPSLDAQSCRIMRQRARFSPARDARGGRVADVYPSRLGWMLQ